MIREILDAIFSRSSTLGDRFMAIVIVLIALVAFGILVLLGFIFFDSVGVDASKTAMTVINKKEVIPAHNTAVPVGKIMTIQHHPASYRIRFEIDERGVDFSVKKKFFDDIKVGDSIEVKYGYGRFTNSPQPKSVRLVFNLAEEE